MNKTLISSLLTAGLFLTSCTESFFDLTPNNAVSTENMFKTESDFKIALIGCYSKLQTQNDFYIEMSEWRSDNMTLDAPTAGTQDRYDIDKFVDTPANGINNDVFANFNNGIYRCNVLLDRIDAVDFDATAKNRIKAEALFIRSYTWFNMYRLWGPIVIADHVVSVNEALGMGRATDAEMYDAIVKPLEQIIDNNMLPASWTGEDMGRVTIGAVRTLLGKIYLTFKQPQKAATVLADVIGKYSLCNTTLDAFDVNNPFNSEIIWSIRYNKSVPGEGHGAWFSLTNLTDNDHRTEAFKNLYTSNDNRAKAIEYVKVPGVTMVLMRKFYDTPDASTNSYGNDRIILRYADALLMYAEALNEVGYNGSQTSPALQALNEVHTRAGLSAIDISDIGNQEAFRHAILIERQKEFPYEGHRWFDAVRLGGVNELAENEGIEVQSYRNIYPYPTTELERVNNTSLVWQNPGY